MLKPLLNMAALIACVVPLAAQEEEPPENWPGITAYAFRWNPTHPLVAGEPFRPDVEVIGMPCECREQPNREAGATPDTCKYFAFNKATGKTGWNAKSKGTLIWLNKNTYGTGDRKGKVVRAVDSIIFPSPGNYTLSLTISCPGELSKLHPLSSFHRQAVFDITVKGSASTGNGGPSIGTTGFDCRNFERQANSLPAWSVGHRQLECMYQLCLQNGHLPGTPEYNRCH
jgi:hypothetical protein